MPGIIYGTAWKKAKTARLVEKAITLGFRGVDTACQPRHYNEHGVGAGVAACLNKGLRREDLYLQTKFTPLDGQDPNNVPYDPNASLAVQVRQSFDASLNNLGTSYLDCLVLHSPMQSLEETMAVWEAMEALVDSGGVKQLGISNCYRLETLEAVCRMARIEPAVVQNRFYAQTGFDCEIRAFCLQHRIFYQSFWTLTANPKILAHCTLQNLASRYGRSPAQVLFRYLTQVGVIPLTGTTSETHMLEDLAIFDFELNKHERDDVTRLLRPPSR
jgi:diketogulonate reductase-like aldo/keto reductase